MVRLEDFSAFPCEMVPFKGDVNLGGGARGIYRALQSLRTCGVYPAKRPGAISSFLHPTINQTCVIRTTRYTLPKFNSSPPKIGRAPKGKKNLPSIIFQGLCVKLQGCNKTTNNQPCKIVFFFSGSTLPPTIMVENGCISNVSFPFP